MAWLAQCLAPCLGQPPAASAAARSVGRQKSPPAIRATGGNGGAASSDGDGLHTQLPAVQNHAAQDHRNDALEAHAPEAERDEQQAEPAPSAEDGAESQLIDDEVLQQGAEVQYRNTDGTLEPARIVCVHHEDVTPYYTVLLLASGTEKQTIRGRLESYHDYSRSCDL